MKRKDGSYWVLLKGRVIPEVAWHDGTGPDVSWSVIGYEYQLSDEHMAYISPKPVEFPGIKENGGFPNGRDAAKLLTL